MSRTVPAGRAVRAILGTALLIGLAGCGSSHRSARPSSTTTAPSTSTTTAAPTTTATTPNTTTPVAATTTISTSFAIQTVDWKNVTLPGSVCGALQPIRLQSGQATVASSRFPGMTTVHVSLSTVVYGDLTGSGQDQAAVNIWCDNGSGTADGQLADSWVVYSAATRTLQVVGTLTTQQPGNPNSPHVAYFNTAAGGIVIAPGKITVHELWYASQDPTCCPSVQATTVWTYANGALTRTGTTQT